MPTIHRSASSLPVPVQSRVSDVAISTLRNVASMQQAKYDSAFRVNSPPVIVYNKLLHGHYCACTYKDPNTPGQTSILGIDGKASQETIQSLLTDSNFGIIDYASNTRNLEDSVQTNPSQSSSINVGSGFGIDVARRSPTDPNANTDLKSGSNQISGNFNEDEDVYRINDSDDIPDASDAPVPDDSGSVLRGSDTKSCPVCLGSGFVGGYSILNGVRVVYDARSSLVALNNAEVDELNAPFKITVQNNGFASFQLTLFKGMVSIDSLTLFKGRYAIPNSEITYSLASPGSNTYTMLNSLNDLLAVADGRTYTLKIQPYVGKMKNLEFTHLEFQCNMSQDPILAEYPQLSETADPNLIQKLQAVQVNLSSRAIQVHSEDVIVDASVAATWWVSDSQNYRDAVQHTIGWSCNVRPMQPYEIQTILPKRVNAAYSGSKTANPVKPSFKPNQYR